MGKPLAERLNSARSTDRVTITDLESLIAEATTERDRLSAASVQAQAESVDFGLTDEDRDEAARKADRLGRTATGLAAVIDELADKLEAKRNSESQKAKAAEQAAALAHRNALAERVRERWPKLEAEMVELLSELKACPEAEMIARSMSPQELNGHLGARRLLDTKLPSFSNIREFAWPRPTPNPMALVGEATRRERLAYERRRDAEAARWSRYMVIPPTENRQGVRIATKRGEGLISRPGEHWMTAEQMADAKAMGCRVEPLKRNESVGGVPERVSY